MLSSVSCHGIQLLPSPLVAEWARIWGLVLPYPVPAAQPSSSKATLWKDQSFTYWESFKALFGVVVLLFIIEAVDQIFFGNRLFVYGVQRGDFGNWHRIFFAPFLHDGWAHLISNSIGLLLLGSIVLALGFRVLLTVTFFAIVS